MLSNRGHCFGVLVLAAEVSGHCLAPQLETAINKVLNSSSDDLL